MATLTRYEIHVNGQFLQGAVLACSYKMEYGHLACKEAGITMEQLWEESGYYLLEYPDLPEGEYLFWFTPEGNEVFLKYHGLVIARACALSEGGEVVVLTREYDPDVIYEDKDQVVYLR